MFDLDRFIADCRSALAEDKPAESVREIVSRAVSNPAHILHRLGEPDRGELRRLYHAQDLTILNMIWAPTMTLMPHDHRMWAVIGIYTGREDNIFWRREPGRSDGRIAAIRARALSVGDTDLLPHNVIHSVHNPINRMTGAIHVYGGDFFAVERSEWDPELLTEQRFDVTRVVRLFEEANERLPQSA